MTVDLLNFDSDTIQAWLETLLQDKEQLSIVGRIAVIAFGTLLASLLTWTSSKLGWRVLKGTGRALRLVRKPSPDADLCREITVSILKSLDETPQAARPQTSVAFGLGYVDLRTGEIRSGKENLGLLLGSGQRKKIWARARAIDAELTAAAARQEKEIVLATFRSCSSTAQPAPHNLAAFDRMEALNQEFARMNAWKPPAVCEQSSNQKGQPA